MFDLLEKLINEHGSSTVLKERLGLVKAQYEALEREKADLQKQYDAAHAQLVQKDVDIQQLQARVQTLEHMHGKYVCDHCGSTKIERVGSRPNPTFKAVGVKDAIYNCLACGKETKIIMN